MAGAFETGKYRNVFAEYGYPEAEIQRRVEQTFETIFYGNEEERFYHEVGADMAYIEDTGNHDVRTEGMSYGMMACVQMNRREEFDRLWKWTRTYMYIEDGPCKNYFAWSCATDGSKNAEGPAPDGEEYFAMALFFAADRWGNGTGIFHYADEARAILRECIHKGEPGHPGEPMWDTSRHLIKFITNCNFSDPSYHLPHFYELFARWADEDDREFWRGAAEASRAYLRSMTGLRMREIRRFSAGMTGITVMRTGRLQILPWTGCGLGEIPGSRRSRENYRVFTAKSRADTGMVCF